MRFVFVIAADLRSGAQVPAAHLARIALHAAGLPVLGDVTEHDGGACAWVALRHDAPTQPQFVVAPPHCVVVTHRHDDAPTTAELHALRSVLAAAVAAAAQRSADAVACALAPGSDVDARDADGNTALVHAAGQGDLPRVHRLLERGARVSASATAISNACVAAVHASFECLDVLLAHLRAEDCTPCARARVLADALECAVRIGNADAALRLLLDGADATALARTTHLTAMATAMLHGRTQIADYMLGAGVPLAAHALDARPSGGLAHVAVMGRNVDAVVWVFRRCGAVAFTERAGQERTASELARESWPHDDCVYAVEQHPELAEVMLWVV